jgi:DNA polymerase-3 subunit alpha
MWKIFGHIMDGAPLRNSLKIAEMCDVNLDDKTYHLPIFPVPDGYDAASYLRYLAQKGLRWRFGERGDESIYQERLERELGIIIEMGFPTYFLIVWDLLQFARHADIWWNVRGSGAGSLVAYCLGITNIDPILNNLLFERFLNPGRVSMPDIDIDFPDDRRMEMISYCSRKYGEDKVAAIITFGTMGAKAAVRDVGRALDVPLDLVTQAAKLIPTEPKPKPVMQYVEDNPELKKMYDTMPDIKRIVDTAEKLQGVSRHASTHAAGIIVADKPLVEYLPLHRLTNESKSGDEESAIKQVTQFPMETCESIGLLKIDFLGLSTLSQLRLTCELIARYHGVKYTMENIPYRPPGDAEGNRRLEQAFQMISRGETIGVFQIESTGMQEMLRGMRPSKFEHIVAAVSLYRPGPMEFIPEYNDRMHGRKEIVYHHEKLRPILEETYAIITYQEQLMQIASELFGYSLGDADLMRRAVSKKKKEDLLKHKEIFLKNGPANGVDEETAGKIFDEIEFFANYGFNKCLLIDALVIDSETNHLVSIGDLVTGKRTVKSTLSLDTETLKLVPSEITAIHENGVKPVYRLTTQLGRTIVATDNHPFFTFDGWRNLASLKKHDLIAVPRCIPLEGKREWHDHEVIVLAHLLAEGNLCHTTGVYYYTTDDGQLADYVGNLEKFENSVASVSIHKAAYSVYSKRRRRSQPQGVVEFIKRLGLWGANSYTKYIPDEVFELKNRQIALLIARMWEGDGHINLKGRSLFYATSSERLVRHLQHLLLRLGIISRIKHVRFAYKDGRFGYQLFVTGNDNMHAFATTIGVHFVSAQRRERMRALFINDPETYGTKDVVPIQIISLVREELGKKQISFETFADQANIAVRTLRSASAVGRHGFTHETISKISKLIDNPRIKTYLNNDVYWDKVVSIEYAGEEMTYDLTVPGTHNFIANDIVVHNSHAADYAVITVQSAYLKCHYPEEYMASLLTIYFDDSDKVTTFLAECKRLNIPILPPDVNASELNFAIEQRADGKRGIRFGLAAVKNAGVGALTHIIEARQQDGVFRDLRDFCERVDLRHVGKRTVESLIKVGAFSPFGVRPDLLPALDRIMAYSAERWKAKEVGQMSMFGGAEGGGDDALLANIRRDGEDISAREQLNWEKELLGFYVSSHPIDPVLNIIRGSNFDTTRDLKSAEADKNGKAVKIVGLVAALRKMPTKNKEMMAIVTLEDHFSTIDVVFFPRTWRKLEDQIHAGEVLQFMGKLDLSRSDPQVIGENVSSEFEAVTSDADYIPLAKDTGKLAWMGDDEALPPFESMSGDNEADEAFFAPPEDAMPASSTSHAAAPPAGTWTENGTSIDDAGEAGDTGLARQAPTGSRQPDDLPWINGDDAEAEGDHAPSDTVPEAAKESGRLLVVHFQRSEDGDRDLRRFNKLFQTITSYPGEDRFMIQIDAHVIEYPHIGIGIGDALIRTLHKLVGADNVDVRVMGEVES